MSWQTEITKIYTIGCDECGACEEDNHYYKGDAEQSFKERGWGFIKVKWANEVSVIKHRCPKCQKKLKEGQ